MNHSDHDVEYCPRYDLPKPCRYMSIFMILIYSFEANGRSSAIHFKKSTMDPKWKDCKGIQTPTHAPVDAPKKKIASGADLILPYSMY